MLQDRQNLKFVGACCLCFPVKWKVTTFAEAWKFATIYLTIGTRIYALGTDYGHAFIMYSSLLIFLLFHFSFWYSAIFAFIFYEINCRTILTYEQPLMIVLWTKLPKRGVKFSFRMNYLLLLWTVHSLQYSYWLIYCLV